MTQRLVIGRPASRSGSWSVTPRQPAESVAAAGEASIRGRLLASVRAWVAAGQLGPDRDTSIGRHTGARC
jgi:hypothetical protein